MGFRIHTRLRRAVVLAPLVCVFRKYLRQVSSSRKIAKHPANIGPSQRPFISPAPTSHLTSTNFSSHQHQLLISPAPSQNGVAWGCWVVPATSVTSPAPSSARNTGHNLSKPTSFDVFPYQVRERPLCFEAGQFGHDTWLGSRGDRNFTSDNVSIDEGIESENFRSGFLVHWSQKLIAQVA